MSFLFGARPIFRWYVSFRECYIYIITSNWFYIVPKITQVFTSSKKCLDPLNPSQYRFSEGIWASGMFTSYTDRYIFIFEITCKCMHISMMYMYIQIKFILQEHKNRDFWIINHCEPAFFTVFMGFLSPGTGPLWYGSKALWCAWCTRCQHRSFSTWGGEDVRETQ